MGAAFSERLLYYLTEATRQPYEADTSIIPFYSWGNGGWQSWESDLGNLTVESVVLIILLRCFSLKILPGVKGASLVLH